MILTVIQPAHTYIAALYSYLNATQSNYSRININHKIERHCNFWQDNSNIFYYKYNIMYVILYSYHNMYYNIMCYHILLYEYNRKSTLLKGFFVFLSVHNMIRVVIIHNIFDIINVCKYLCLNHCYHYNCFVLFFFFIHFSLFMCNM